MKIATDCCSSELLKYPHHNKAVDAIYISHGNSKHGNHYNNMAGIFHTDDEELP